MFAYCNCKGVENYEVRVQIDIKNPLGSGFFMSINHLTLMELSEQV